jgi:hypothetical protein
MSRHDQIQQELAKATKGLQDGNEGLARVCARRAVAIGTQNLAERTGTPAWPGDAMHQLRRIQEEESFPLEVREAAQRLITTVAQRDRAPMSTDPIADARIILDHLNA